MSTYFVRSLNMSNSKFEIAINKQGYPETRSVFDLKSSEKDITNNMLTLLQNCFGLDAIRFMKFLRNRKAALAGSSTLWVQAPWCDYQDFDGDLDIWIREDDELSALKSDPRHCNLNRVNLMAPINSFFDLHGYSPVARNSSFPDRNDYLTQVDSSFKYINTIYSFTRELTHRGIYKEAVKKTHKIQVMLLNRDVAEMVNLFDISLTRCLWFGDCINPPDITNFFPREELENKTFTLSSVFQDVSHKESRIRKYEKRGFTFVPPVDKPNEPSDSSEPVALDKPEDITPELCSFLKLTPSAKYPRKITIQLLLNYVKTHHLQCPDNKNKVLCDGPMYDLFKISHCTFVELQRAVLPHVNTKVVKTELYMKQSISGN